MFVTYGVTKKKEPKVTISPKGRIRLNRVAYREYGAALGSAVCVEYDDENNLLRLAPATSNPDATPFLVKEVKATKGASVAAKKAMDFFGVTLEPKPYQVDVVGWDDGLVLRVP